MNNSPTLRKVKCFGDKAALTVEECVTEDGELTVVFEVAHVRSSDNNNKTYDWRNKEMFQLANDELFVVAGLFLGYVPSFKIERSDKSLELTRQRKGSDGRGYGSLYVKAYSAGEALYTLPMTPGGVAQVGQLILGRIEQRELSGPELLLAAIKGGCALLT